MSQALFPGWLPSERDRRVLQSWTDAAQSLAPGGATLPTWRRPDQWHLTLCFIGYGIDAETRARACDVLARIAQAIPPHDIRIESLAHWSGRRSMPLVALPAASRELRALCDAIRDGLRGAGIAILQATTTPHITLGYYDGGTPPQRWLDGVRGATGAMAIDGVDLLFNPGGRYESLGSWNLNGSGLPVQPEQTSLF